MSSKPRRRVTVDNEKSVSDGERRKPSVFERLGDLSRGIYSTTEPPREKCHTFMKTGRCPYGSKCKYPHPTRRDRSPEDYHYRTTHRRDEDRREEEAEYTDSEPESRPREKESRKDKSGKVKSAVVVTKSSQPDSDNPESDEGEEFDFEDTLRLEKQRQFILKQLQEEERKKSSFGTSKSLGELSTSRSKVSHRSRSSATLGSGEISSDESDRERSLVHPPKAKREKSMKMSPGAISEDVLPKKRRKEKKKKKAKLPRSPSPEMQKPEKKEKRHHEKEHRKTKNKSPGSKSGRGRSLSSDPHQKHRSPGELRRTRSRSSSASRSRSPQPQKKSPASRKKKLYEKHHRQIPMQRPALISPSKPEKVKVAKRSHSPYVEPVPKRQPDSPGGYERAKAKYKLSISPREIKKKPVPPVELVPVRKMISPKNQFQERRRRPPEAPRPRARRSQLEHMTVRRHESSSSTSSSSSSSSSSDDSSSSSSSSESSSSDDESPKKFGGQGKWKGQKASKYKRKAVAPGSAKDRGQRVKSPEDRRNSWPNKSPKKYGRVQSKSRDGARERGAGRDRPARHQVMSEVEPRPIKGKAMSPRGKKGAVVREERISPAPRDLDRFEGRTQRQQEDKRRQVSLDRDRVDRDDGRERGGRWRNEPMDKHRGRERIRDQQGLPKESLADRRPPSPPIPPRRVPSPMDMGRRPVRPGREGWVDRLDRPDRPEWVERPPPPPPPPPPPRGISPPGPPMMDRHNRFGNQFERRPDFRDPIPNRERFERFGRDEPLPVDRPDRERFERERDPRFEQDRHGPREHEVMPLMAFAGRNFDQNNRRDGSRNRQDRGPMFRDDRGGWERSEEMIRVPDRDASHFRMGHEGRGRDRSYDRREEGWDSARSAETRERGHSPDGKSRERSRPDHRPHDNLKPTDRHGREMQRREEMPRRDGSVGGHVSRRQQWEQKQRDDWDRRGRPFEDRRDTSRKRMGDEDQPRSPGGKRRRDLSPTGSCQSAGSKQDLDREKVDRDRIREQRQGRPDRPSRDRGKRDRTREDERSRPENARQQELESEKVKPPLLDDMRDRREKKMLPDDDVRRSGSREWKPREDGKRKRSLSTDLDHKSRKRMKPDIEDRDLDTRSGSHHLSSAHEESSRKGSASPQPAGVEKETSGDPGGNEGHISEWSDEDKDADILNRPNAVKATKDDRGEATVEGQGLSGMEPKSYEDPSRHSPGRSSLGSRKSHREERHKDAAMRAFEANRDAERDKGREMDRKDRNWDHDRSKRYDRDSGDVHRGRDRSYDRRGDLDPDKRYDRGYPGAPGGEPPPRRDDRSGDYRDRYSGWERDRDRERRRDDRDREDRDRYRRGNSSDLPEERRPLLDLPPQEFPGQRDRTDRSQEDDRAQADEGSEDNSAKPANSANMYEEWDSEESDLEKILEGVEDEDEDKEKVDPIDIDWKSVLAETCPKPAAPVSALKRFTPAAVFARTGVSRALAGAALTDKVQQVCQQQLEAETNEGETEKDTKKEPTEEEKEVKEEGQTDESADKKQTEETFEEKTEKPTFEFLHGIAAFHTNFLLKKQERRSLLTDFGPFRRALCARRDLVIRRKLCKLGKEPDSGSAFPTQSVVDQDLFKQSLQLFKYERPEKKWTLPETEPVSA